MSLDAEWTPAHLRFDKRKKRGPVAVIQLAVPTLRTELQRDQDSVVPSWRQLVNTPAEVHLFHLSRMSGTVQPKNPEHCGTLPQELQQLLRSESIVFVGRNIANDRTLINQDFRAEGYPLMLPRVCEIAKKVHEVGLHSWRAASLEELVMKVLKRDLPKEGRIGRWDETLSQDAALYAARDVLALYKLFYKSEIEGLVLENHPPRGKEFLAVGKLVGLLDMRNTCVVAYARLSEAEPDSREDDLCEELNAKHCIQAKRCISVKIERLERLGALLPVYVFNKPQSDRQGPTLKDFTAIEESRGKSVQVAWPKWAIASVKGEVLPERRRDDEGHYAHGEELTASTLELSHGLEPENTSIGAQNAQLQSSQNDASFTRVKRDVFHAMDCLTQTLSRSHAGFKRFERLLSEAMLPPALEDLRACWEWCHKHYRSLGYSRPSDLYGAFYKIFMRDHVRKIIPEPNVLEQRLCLLRDAMADLTDKDSGSELFTEKAHSQFNRLLKHVGKGCISDCPSEPLYRHVRGKNGLQTYASMRGTSRVESWHSVLRNLLSSPNTRPETANARLREGAFRWNLRRSLDIGLINRAEACAEQTKIEAVARQQIALFGSLDLPNFQSVEAFVDTGEV